MRNAEANEFVRSECEPTREFKVVAKTKRVTGDTEIFSGLIRIHVLHHACVEGVFGLGMINELRRHGYKVGPGTMYPLLYGMEKRGWLRSRRHGSTAVCERYISQPEPGKRLLKRQR